MDQSNTPTAVGSNAELGLDSERADFEAWCCKRWSGDREALRRRDMPGSERLGEYVNGHVQFAWCAWQAGQAAERERWRGIERQEAAGQRTLVESAMLPKEIRGATREQLTALGFKFGADVDDLFVTCELPPGWKKRGTDHSMHSDLLDEQGRKRAGIFYKAAFYDRRADMSMERRYRVDCYRDGSSEAMRRVDVTDCGQVIKEFGEVKRDDWDGMDALEKDAKSWLTEQHPEWQNPLACW